VRLMWFQWTGAKCLSKPSSMSRCLLLETGKNLGAVDGRGHAGLAGEWRKKRKLRVHRNSQLASNKDGSIATTRLGTTTFTHLACYRP
jgi:hypothetical protein